MYRTSLNNTSSYMYMPLIPNSNLESYKLFLFLPKLGMGDYENMSQ